MKTAQSYKDWVRIGLAHLFLFLTGDWPNEFKKKKLKPNIFAMIELKIINLCKSFY